MINNKDTKVQTYIEHDRKISLVITQMKGDLILIKS